MPSNSTARRTSVASPGARDRRPPWAGRRVTPDSAATAPALPGPVKCWVLGARPRTLPAAIVPVVVGTAAAHPLSPRAGAVGVYAPLVHQAGAEVGVWWRALGALVVALAIQVGTNYANDYSDGIRGTDDARVGPLRLVASGLASPSAVKRAALLSFGVAGVAGLALAWATSWWILVVGAACLAAGWLYTGGPRPYGYAGLGEVFVFVFFGLVATVGTYYVQTLRMDQPVVWFAAVVVGLLATALLLANNLRDIETDRETGKHTLAVRVGRSAAGRCYVACVALPFVGVLAWAVLSVTGAVGADHPAAAFLPLLALPLALAPARLATGDASGRALLPVLAATGRLQLVFGALLSVSLWLWIS
jgi:1,4-dihydroxy-2-naphthoate octaprenyltransferase